MTWREWGYWGLALGVSLGAHAWLWLAADAGMDGGRRGTVPRQRVMLVGLRTLPVPVPEPVPAPARPVPRKAVESPRPPAPVRQPPPKAVPKPKPVPAAKARAAPPVATTPPPTATPAPRPAPPVAPQVPVSSSDSGKEELEQRRLEYLQRLVAYIDRYKFYPRSARRRGLEGRVRVVFRMSPQGKVSGVTARGDHGTLERAAAEAVRAAQPLPPPPPGLALPEKVSFVMEYRLR